MATSNPEWAYCKDCGDPATHVYRPTPKNSYHEDHLRGYCDNHNGVVDPSLQDVWSIAPIVRQEFVERNWDDKPKWYDYKMAATEDEYPIHVGQDTTHKEVYHYLPGGKSDSGTDRITIMRYYLEAKPEPITHKMTSTGWMAEAVNMRNGRIGLLKTLVAIAGTKPRVNTATASAVGQPSVADATESTTMSQATPAVVEARVIAIGGAGQQSVVSFLVPGQSAPQALRTLLPDGEYKSGDQVHLQVEVENRYKVIGNGKPGSLGAVSVLGSHVPSAAEVHPGGSASKAITTSGSGIVGLRKVKVPANFYVTDGLKRYFNALQKLSAHGKPVRGRLIGPTGVGKTTGVYYFAGLTDRPFLKVNMSTISAPEELFGIRTLEDGKTGFQETAFVRALQTPNACIFLEEINRTHSSNVNPLMEVLDGFGETWIDAVQQLIVVDPSVTIFAAMNVGASYTGTFDMDAALESRFEYPIELSYLPDVEEAKVLVLKTGVDPRIAQGMVELAGDTRRMAQSESTDALDKAISTRTLLAACDLIAIGGMSPDEALKATVLPLYSTEGGDASQRARVAKITQGKFATSSSRR